MHCMPPGMKRMSYYWESGERIIRRLSCPHLFYQVTACTLVFLLLHMQPPQIVALLFFIIQGEYSPCYNFKFLIYVVTNFYSIELLCWASPSEFVIPLAKYVKVVYHTLVSVGMRFRMLFESEESSVRW